MEPTRDPSRPGPVGDDERSPGRRLAVRAGVLAVPLGAVAWLCLALGLPWWLVGIGVAVFVAIFVLEA